MIYPDLQLHHKLDPSSVSLVDGALLAMVSALLAAVLAIMFDQRRENAKTRDLIGVVSTQVAALAATSAIHTQQLADLKRAYETTQEQLNQISGQVAALAATSAIHTQQLADLKHAHETTAEDTKQQLSQISASLGHARERLAHIEGYLAIGSSGRGELEASV